MTDTGAHPGVRSLLARFENNQNATSSPPPRGRSPVGSDASGTSRRPLSKVRASFIAVEGGSQSSPMVGLRRVSGHSDSPPPPSRVRSFNSDDLEGSVKSLGSSVQTSNGFGGAPKAIEKAINENPVEASSTTLKGLEQSTAPANKENQPTSHPATLATSAISSPKPAKTVTKRPSTMQVGKNVSTGKSASQAPGMKSSTQPRTPTSPVKPDTTKPARSSRPSTVKNGASDSLRAPVHKPSRTSLNTAPKTSARPTRSSPPAREAAKSSRSSDIRSTSSTRTTRPLGSATAPTSASAGKLGVPSTLNRKPSSLRNTGSAAPKRAVTPTASSVRKQVSRPSPGQSGTDRPHSRVSNESSKPVDEGFLARMMRPTASSANKAHEKLEIKSPPRGKPAQAPGRAPSKMEIRQPRLTKDKAPAKKSQESEPVPTEVPIETKIKEQEQLADAVEENYPEQVTTESSVEPTNESTEPIDVEEKSSEEASEDVPGKVSEETPLEISVEAPPEAPVDSPDGPIESQHGKEAADAPIKPPVETSNELLVEPIAEESAENPTETSLEPLVEEVAPVFEEPASPPIEAAVVQEIEPSDANNAELATVRESTVEDAISTFDMDENAASPSTETAVPESDSKPKEVDIDIDKLTIN